MNPRPVVLPDGRRLTFERARIMGIVNVTPDSFSDGGRFPTVGAAVAHGMALAEAGADVLDVGGESTRPGSEAVDAEVQIARVVPVVDALVREGAPPVSVDTTSARVAEAAIDVGAVIVNDISAFRFDPQMLEVLARTAAAGVAMHTLGPPKTMQAAPSYDDVVGEVITHLAQRLAVCEAHGVPAERILVDPGIGFGKLLPHNLALLRGIPRLCELGRPVLVGPSRKRFLGELTGRSVDQRVDATGASCVAAIALGAHMLRIHDVADLAEVIAVADAIANGAPD
jgi:dihydropteroate synthase